MKKTTFAVVLTALLSALCAFVSLTLAARTPHSELTLNPGDRFRLDAPEEAVFLSEHPLIASVSLFGEVSALTPGETVITVTGRDGQQKITVIVAGEPLTALTFPQKEAMLLVGEQWALPYEINPGATDTRMDWTSSDESVVTVTDDGILTAHAPGTVQITACAMNGLTAQCEVTVVAPE